MRIQTPTDNIKTFDYTYEFDRNLFLFYEFLIIFDEAIPLKNEIVEKKMKNLINYLSNLIYPLPPKDYALNDEKFFITDTYELEKF